MCFGKTPSYQASPAPEVTPAPVAAPAPSTIEPTEVAAQTQQERRRKIAAVRYGMMSTIKTTGQGISGTGANLYADTTGKKTTLGA